MLNKIKIIGKILINKERNERKIDDLAVQESMNEMDKTPSQPEVEKEYNKEKWFYFSLMVTVPSGSLTALRCVAQGEMAERIKKEVQTDEVIEAWGYLRNEQKQSTNNNKGRDSLQIIIRVIGFNQLDLAFAEIDQKSSNQVRLLGKIITDLQDPEIQQNLEKLSFKLAVPREGVKSPLFFCQVKEKELISEVKEKLKKGDVILLEGFLQTRILQTQEIEGEMDEKKRVSYPRASSIICRGFTFLDSDSASIFSPLENLTRIVKDIREIDFTKPKAKRPTDTEIN